MFGPQGGLGGDGDGGTGATRAAVAVAVGDAVWERVAVGVGVPVGGTGRRREAVAVPVAVAADLRAPWVPTPGRRMLSLMHPLMLFSKRGSLESLEVPRRCGGRWGD